MLRIFSFISLFVLIPEMSFAATTFKSLVVGWVTLLQNVFAFIFVLIFVYIAWTLINTWVRHGDSESSVVEGRSKLFAAIIGLVVLAALWGIVGYAQSLLLS